MIVTVTYSKEFDNQLAANSFTFGDQITPDLLGPAAGGFVSAYVDDTTNQVVVDFVRASRLDSFFNFFDGATRFPAAGATSAGGAPALTQLKNQNILVAWDENDAGDPGIKGRLFSAAGQLIGNELALAAGTTPTDPQVAALRDGGFALTFTDGAFSRVAVFDDNGGGAVLPDSSPAGAESDGTITALADGGFVVTFTNGGALYARVYEANGTARSGNILLDNFGGNTQSKVTALPNGNWAVAYRDSGWLDADAGNSGITMRIYQPNGDPASSDPIHVNTPGASAESDPDITALANGFIVVSWSHPVPATFTTKIFARVFDQDGNPVPFEDSGTAEFDVSRNTDGASAHSAVAALQGYGGFITSWQGGDLSGDGIDAVVTDMTRLWTADDADDTMTGDGLHDVMKGGGGSDTLMGGRGGYNVLIGEAGDDTAVYEFGIESYIGADGGIGLTQLAYLPDLLRGVTGNVGIDYLHSSIEHVRFADGTVHLQDGSGEFDTLFYMCRNPDVFHAGANAMEHFNTFGWREGRDPNMLFDTSAYLAVNKDVAAAGINPLDHYHQSGWREGRDPGPLFDTKLYLLNNPDVAAAGVDPFEHYLTFGRFEFRSVDSAIGEIKSCFDAQWYLFHYDDVAAAGVDPFLHYQTSGWREGRNPNGFFDTSLYLLFNQDVAAAGVNPLEHYHQFGWKEGRDTWGGFLTSAYLAKNPDVAAAGVDPLEHFLTFGIYEGRDPLGL